MSVEIYAEIACDSCGITIRGGPQKTTTDGMRAYWWAKEKAQKDGWVTLQRYGPAKHFCRECADKPQVKLKETLK